MAGFLRRLLLSATASVVLLTVASATMFLTSWPAWLSLLLEPFSLLLTPGVLGSMLFTHTHDYTSGAIVLSNLAFYFPVFFCMLWVWDREAGRSGGSGSRRKTRFK